MILAGLIAAAMPNYVFVGIALLGISVGIYIAALLFSVRQILFDGKHEREDKTQ